MDPILMNANAAQGGGGMGMFTIVWIILIFVVMYVIMILPQRKEQKKKAAMKEGLVIGDTVLTTSGFYGVVIDINKEQNMIIVEFGSNKNCRIPMTLEAVSASEKPGAAAKAEEEKKAKEKAIEDQKKAKEKEKADKKAAKKS